MKLICDAATAPRLYGLPKIHKPNLPLRPISSSMDVPCYGLSKHIGSTLQHLVSDKYNIKNSAELKHKLKDFTLKPDEIIVSFDVVSLFTNIPTHLAIRNIMDQWDKIKEHTNITRAGFLKILNFCLKDNNYFTFNNKFYNQTFGMPMGNPLSPTIADIILDNLLNSAIEILENKNINIRFIVKYVDDILAIIKSDEQDEILKTLNNYHPKLQFTVEKENNRTIPYLDIKLHIENNKIKTNWYTKPTSSGRIMNFYSTQPISQKMNTAYNMINKALTLSDKEFHSDNIIKLKNILLNNDYPLYIIKNLIEKQQLNSTSTISNINLNTDEPSDKKYFSIRFIPTLTDKRALAESITQNNHTQFAYKPNQSLRNIFTKTKDKIETREKHDVVYQIKCKGNKEEKCKQIYIGTTKRAVATRMREHETDINKQKLTTALAQHMIEHKHEADFDNIKILDTEKRGSTRYTLEALRIQQTRGTMNIKEDTDKISTSYLIAI